MSDFDERSKIIEGEKSSKPPNAGKRWTSEMILELTDYNDRGLSMDDIANKMGRTEKSVVAKLNKLNHKPKKVKSSPKKKNEKKLWNDDRNAQLLRYGDSNMTIDQICKEMGSTPREIVIQYGKLTIGDKTLKQCSMISLLNDISEGILSQ